MISLKLPKTVHRTPVFFRSLIHACMIVSARRLVVSGCLRPSAANLVFCYTKLHIFLGVHSFGSTSGGFTDTFHSKDLLSDSMPPKTLLVHLWCGRALIHLWVVIIGTSTNRFG